MQNIIILTCGLSGSSVLAHLISKEGFWVGDSIKEIDYKTFENSRLVDLNVRILNSSGYRWKDVMDIPPPSIRNIENLASRIEKKDDFSKFAEKCNEHSPWLWKDPRLCYTIFFWRKYISVRNCKFILMSRDIRQSWTGIVLRGKMPISYGNLEIIERNCLGHAIKFLAEEKIEYLSLTFEDLITRPEDSLGRINKFLGLRLDMDQFKAVYRGPMHRLRWSKADFLKAQCMFAFYKYLKRDPIHFPRIIEGKGSGWRHRKIAPVAKEVR